MIRRGVTDWLLPLIVLFSCACTGTAGPAKPAAATSTPGISLPAYAYDCRSEAALDLSTASPGPVQYETMIVDSRLRDYRLYTPESLDTTKPFPLVVLLHGAPDDASDFEDIVHFQAEAALAGVMAVYPDGCNEDWNQAGGSYDVHFINKLIDRLEGAYQIDRSRVYVAGVSAGAFMAYRLACDLADRVAAVASLSGSMWWNDCAPSRAIPVLEIHGTADKNVPYDGGRSTYNYVSVEPVSTVMQRWVVFDGCTGSPVLTRSGITTTSLWNHCQGGTAVRLDTVIGGHHTWFGSDFDPVPGEPNANLLVWSFLSQYRLET